MSLLDFVLGDVYHWRGRETTPRMLTFGSGAVMAPMSSEKKRHVEIKRGIQVIVPPCANLWVWQSISAAPMCFPLLDLILNCSPDPLS